MSPTGAAVTLEALDTGLRQYQPDSRNPVTVGLSGGCRHVTGGDLLQIATGRFREAGESTVTKDTAGGATHSGNCEAVGVRAHTSGRCRPVVDRPNRVNLRDTRAAPTYSIPAHASLGRTRVPILQLAVVITPKTRTQRSRAMSPMETFDCRAEITWPPACLPIQQTTFRELTWRWHGCARITRYDTCVHGGMAVEMGLDGVDQRLPRRGTAILWRPGPAHG